MFTHSKRRRAAWVALAVPAILIGAAACSTPGAGDAATASSGDGEFSIGVMLKDTTIPFFGRQIQGYEDAAEEFDVDVHVYNGKGDSATQVALVQQMITKGDDLIIVTPGDPQALNGVLQQAADAGIPVMAVNSAPGEMSNLISFVGADDIAYGEGLGNLVVEATGGEGEIAVIRGKLGDPPDALRQQGLESVLKDYPGIKIVAEQAADWDAASALSVTQDFLSRFPSGQLDVIVDVGPEVASGAEYAHKNGREDVKFIVGDFPTNVKKGIEDGYIFGAVNQDPYHQSYTAIELAKKYLEGDTSSVQKTVFLDLPEVTLENVADYPAAW